jgi:drug/metabolite transporter (DMT)-like permease
MNISSMVRIDARPQNFSWAVGMMMLSVTTYACQDVFVKLMPSHISVMQICFFRSVFAMLPIIAFTIREDPRTVFKTDQWGLHFWRSLFSCLALFCFISAFRLIPLADAYTLTFSCPLFMTALCIPLLRETVPFWRWLAVLTGFGGVIIMMRPGYGVLEPGGLFALAGGFFYAISQVLVRKLSHHHQDSNTLIVITFTIMSGLLTVPFLPFVWQPLNAELLAKFALIGVLGGVAQYAMTQALRLAPVSKIAPFDYAALLWAVGFGYFIFHEIPHVYTVFGALLIIGSGFVIVRSEKVSSVS